MAKNWLKGVDLTAVSLYTGTRNASTGVVSWSGSPSSLTNVVDYVRFSDDRMLEMIASVNDVNAHYEQTLYDATVTLGEILTKGTPILPGLASTGQYLKVMFTRGGQSYTFTGIIRSFNDGVTAYGKNACEMTLAQFNNDGTPVTYA